MRAHINDLPFSVYDITDGKNELIGNFGFTATDVWYVYSSNKYELSAELTGIHDIKFVFSHSLVFGGFRFTENNPAYSGICAADCNVVYGDAYDKRDDGIYGIGNNVTVRFADLDLSDGASSVTIRAKTRNAHDAIRLTVGETSYSIEFENGEDCVTVPVEISGIVTADLVFLPGANFDLFEIKFNK